MGRPRLTNIDEVVSMYKSGMSYREIAATIGRGKSTVRDALKAASHPVRELKDRYRIAREKGLLGAKNPPCGERNHAYLGVKARRGYRLVVPVLTVCEICGTPADLAIHHIDCNPRNNDRDNLKIVCRSCHTTIHRKDRFRRKREIELEQLRTNAPTDAGGAKG